MDDVPVAPREKVILVKKIISPLQAIHLQSNLSFQAGGRRAAANIKFDKYKSDESDGSDGSDELFENSGVEEDEPKPKAKAKAKKEPKTYDIGSSDEDSPPKKKAAPKKQTSITDNSSFKTQMCDLLDLDWMSSRFKTWWPKASRPKSSKHQYVARLQKKVVARFQLLL